VNEMLDNPLVTIVMSVYNAEASLRCSLESLLGQTYENLQIVVINDGSTDGSRQIVDSYKDDRIKFIDRMANVGLTRSLNQGLAIARGRYIARHDADDISVGTRIAEQVAYFQANPHVDILGTGVELFDGRETLRSVIYDNHSTTFREQLLHFINPVPHSTLMFRKRILNVLKGYNECFLLAQDYDFLLRASEVFTIGSLQRSLVKLRFTHNSLTHADTRQLKFGLASVISAHRRLMGRCDYSQEQHEEWGRFLQKIDAYIHKYHWARRFTARTYLKKARFAMRAYQPGKCLTSLFRAVMSDATCLTRRGIGLRIPRDIQIFLTDDLICGRNSLQET
jgi:glycosyltransferase involved in cell wall biosynthesis